MYQQVLQFILFSSRHIIFSVVNVFGLFFGMGLQRNYCVFLLIVIFIITRDD